MADGDRVALLVDQDGVVRNRVVVGTAKFEPPPGLQLVDEIPGADIGDEVDPRKKTIRAKRRPAPATEPARSIEERMARMEMAIARIEESVKVRPTAGGPI